MTGRVPRSEFTNGFDGHRRAQALQGLRMTPAERLAWLESTMARLRSWQGRARARRNPTPTVGASHAPATPVQAAEPKPRT